MSHTDELRERICRRYKEAGADKYPTRISPYIFDDNSEKRVAVYARFASPPLHDSDYELPKRYYSDMISMHPRWECAGFYFDSAPANAYRPEFERMLADCRAGKIDLIITKSISRFMRDIVKGLSALKELAELSLPVGVYFENESVYSLNSSHFSCLNMVAKMAVKESEQKGGRRPYYMKSAGGIVLNNNQHGGKNESE